MELQLRAFCNQARTESKENFSLKTVYQLVFKQPTGMTPCYVNLVSKVQTSRDNSWERGWCYVSLSVTAGQATLICISMQIKLGGNIEAIPFHCCSNLVYSSSKLAKTTCRVRDLICLLRGCTCVILAPSLPFYKRPCCILNPSALPFVALKKPKALDGVENSSRSTCFDRGCVARNES